MNTYFCDICRGSYKSSRALATHKATCLLENLPHVRPVGRRNIADTRPPIPSVSTVDEAPSPSEPFVHNQPLDFQPLADDSDDCLDEDYFEIPYNESFSNSYDSTYSLVQWIRTVKKTAGLSNSDIDKLFKHVLLHPLFKIENLVVKSALDVQNYEKSYYNENDEWRSQEIQGYKLHHRDSLIALETLFSSPMNAENFEIKPITQHDTNGDRIYSTPATGKWWHFMQVSF